MIGIRSPIVSVLGHVDHGKSSILDAIRGSNVVRGEAGGITQAIGASIMPYDVIWSRCGRLIERLKMKITIPGILFIDTPGHAAFTSLRKRGGSLADIAILVVDINEGFKPQTVEALEILKNTKTPFVVAANKIDLVAGFTHENENFLANLAGQSDSVKQELDKKVYELVGEIYKTAGIESERFDRVGDYTKQVAIVPCSAVKGIGLNELLMVITGLSQRFLEQNLLLNVEGPAKGVIIEVKDDKGLGRTIDIILYDGSLSVGDQIIIGTLDEPVIAKVRALLMPSPLRDMRDKNPGFTSVKSVLAATGVKISSPEINEKIIPGMPVFGFDENYKERILELAKSEVEESLVSTDGEGVVIKSDTLGGLEALASMLREKGIKIRKASVGNITKKDIGEAESVFDENPVDAAILGFNIKQETSTYKAKIFVKDVIYTLVEEYEEWKKKAEEALEAKKLHNAMRPAKIEVLKNCIFRMSNPCIAGIEVLEGFVRNGMKLMDFHGHRVGEIKSMQSSNENLNVAEKGRQVAASMPGVTAGRQVHEGEVYLSDLSEDEYRKLKELAKHLSKPEIELLKEIALIKRKNNPVWGV